MNNSRATIYTVRPGDTLWKIASLYEVGISELIKENPQISNPDLIYIGEQIRIPAQGTYREMEREIIRLVNDERAKRGLPRVEENWQISRVARIKSEDMINNNYFSHNSPIYGSPFKMLSSFGINYTQAAENIALGQLTARQVMDSWMNSPGHRANILNANYNQIGVGVARKGSQGPFYFTQIFVKSR